MDDFTSSYLRAQEGIAHSAFSPPAARVFDVLLKISFLLERNEARVPVLQDLVIAADVHKGNLSRHLRELITSDAITMREDNGEFFFEPMPDWKQWRCRRRYTYAEEATMEKALQRLIEIGKSNPGQLEIPGMERPEDFDAEVSRQFAAASVVPGTTEHPPSNKKVVRGTTNEEVVHGTTGLPHEGVVRGTTDPTCSEHVEEHVVQNMLHEHASRRDEAGTKKSELNLLSIAELEARLSPEQEHVLEQLGELPGVLHPRFRRTWLLRLLDRNSSAVISAVGEARHKKAIGWRPNKSWGEYLNDAYLRLRDAMREGARKLHLW